MKCSTFIQPSLFLGIAISATLLLPNGANGEGDLINQFGNLVLPNTVVYDAQGIMNLRDSSGSAGESEDIISLDEGLEIIAAVKQLREDVIDATTGNPSEQLDIGFALDNLLEQLEGKAASATLAGQGNPFGNLGGEILLNVPGAGAISQAIANLPTANFITGDAVQAAINVVADADPYLSIGGTITNTSETESLSVFLPFEESFLEPIALDADLVRQTFFEVSLDDTNGDGSASLQNGQVAFQVLATEDLDDPTFFNADNIGTSETLGISRITDTTDPRILTRLSNVQAVNRSRIDRVDADAVISHLTGEFRIEDLSPGDSVTFTAVVSLGIEGDSLTPLISADAIAAIHQAGQFLDANRGVVPEPSSAVLLATSLLSLICRCRR